MKIGVNTRLLLPGTLEGIGRFSYEVLKRMVSAHPEDEFYFYFDRPFDKKYVIGSNVIPKVIKPTARTPIQWYWWFEKALPKAMVEDKIDVFFSPELYGSLKTTLPSVLIAHDIAYFHFPEHFRWHHRIYLKKYTPLFLQKATRIGCVSHTTKQDLVQSLNIAPDKLFIAENGPTPGFVPISEDKKIEVRNRITAGHLYFLYLGSIHPRKNTANLVQAYNLFRSENPQSLHKLVLVGRMAWKTGETTAAIEQSTYRNDIIHLGQRTDATEILAAADALLYVSLFEGFGIPILEAFATQTPVITSNLGSMKEVTGEAALLVDPLKVQDIAEAMALIQQDENLRRDLIAKAIKRLELYSWDHTSKKVYSELSELSSRNLDK